MLGKYMPTIRLKIRLCYFTYVLKFVIGITILALPFNMISGLYHFTYIDAYL